MRQLFSYLACGDSDRKASCRSGRPISGAKVKAWRHRMFNFTPLLISLCLYWIINHFACWITNAYSSEKRCPTSMSFWHQADWHKIYRSFKVHYLITWESKVQVVVSLGRYEVLFALRRHEDLTNDMWHAFLQSENVFELGGITIFFYELLQVFGIQVNLSQLHSDAAEVPLFNIIPPFSVAGSSRACILPESW